MADVDANQEIRSDDPAWHFLAELSLSEILADPGWDELTDGLLFQTERKLGMPPECIENIKKTLSGCAKEAWVQFKQGRLEGPGRIRLFCQQKILNDTNLAMPPKHTETAGEHIKMSHHSTAKMNGGWGFFVIEKGGKLLTGSFAPSWISVDLYLYKEGE